MARLENYCSKYRVCPTYSSMQTYLCTKSVTLLYMYLVEHEKIYFTFLSYVLDLECVLSRVLEKFITNEKFDEYV